MSRLHKHIRRNRAQGFTLKDGFDELFKMQSKNVGLDRERAIYNAGAIRAISISCQGVDMQSLDSIETEISNKSVEDFNYVLSKLKDRHPVTLEMLDYE